MNKMVDRLGKRYLEITEREENRLKGKTRIYYLPDGRKAIAPTDCDHALVTDKETGIFHCTRCIYWGFTDIPEEQGRISSVFLW